MNGSLASSCDGDDFSFDSHTWTAPGYRVACASLSLDVRQANNAPCSPENTITVELTATTPLLCTNERLIISGMGCRATDTQSLLLTQDPPAVFLDTAQWTCSGQIEVELAAKLQQGDVRTFSFQVTNPPSNCSTTQSIHVALTVASACSAGLVVVGDLTVETFSFLANSTVVQSSHTPCADNVSASTPPPPPLLLAHCRIWSSLFFLCLCVVQATSALCTFSTL